MIDKSLTCCFTGHRIISNETRQIASENLEKHINKLIKKGITTFISGGALGFDTIAAETVLKFQKDNPEIQLILALPCIEQDKNWRKVDKIRYQEILENANRIIYVSEFYNPDCMQKRNRFMIDNSSYCILYLTKMNTGTASTIKYAIENDDTELINVLSN
ncbi:MAG: SLOG family protein [Oscillospiraceae bacterium]